MIEILIEHSAKEDYSVIDEIVVSIKKAREKERIENLIQEHELVGAFVEHDDQLAGKIADLLEVNENLILIDTFEIDGVADEEPVAETADQQ